MSSEGDLPEHWPPRPGDVWSDQLGDAWFCYAPAPGQLYLAHQGEGAVSDVTGDRRSLGTMSARDPGLPAILVRLEWRATSPRIPV